ncbi:protease complex subunit PrcB family protein [Flavobacterium sp.]|uniref:protease complex subunit PrcB family protein n=1 Tax=Flavobacterium sp. TaxID=239 RepID=UPI002629B296|nr:protease complex subunit PrcB family protein [Flavobacterium sp.]
MKIIQFLFLFLILTSCSSENDANIPPQAITPTLIASGSLYGSGSENIVQQNIVVSNQADWTALINQMDTVNNTSSSFTELNIDFDNYQLLLAFDQVRPTGGFSIAINNVTETANTIEATVNVTGPGEIATMVITQPFYIVKIPKSTKPVVFL